GGPDLLRRVVDGVARAVDRALVQAALLRYLVDLPAQPVGVPVERLAGLADLLGRQPVQLRPGRVDRAPQLVHPRRLLRVRRAPVVLDVPRAQAAVPVVLVAELRNRLVGAPPAGRVVARPLHAGRSVLPRLRRTEVAAGRAVTALRGQLQFLPQP